MSTTFDIVQKLWNLCNILRDDGVQYSDYVTELTYLLCPCHQSTFDLADAGNVVFGPAARRMPQLPIGVDEEGYLVAMSDFAEPIGPSFWERG